VALSFAKENVVLKDFKLMRFCSMDKFCRSSLRRGNVAKHDMSYGASSATPVGAFALPGMGGSMKDSLVAKLSSNTSGSITMPRAHTLLFVYVDT